MRLARLCLVPPVFLLATCTSPAVAPRPSPAATETIDITVHEGTTLAFDLSPDGRSIVFDLLGQLWRLPASGGDARPITDAVRDTAEDLDPSWSPDGRRIVFRAERRGRTGLWLLDAGPAIAQPTQLTQLEDPRGYDGDAAWSPDGKTIAFARVLPPAGTPRRPRSRVELMDVATRQVRELAVTDTTVRNVSDPAWEPGGRRLAVVAAPVRSPYGGRVWIVDATSGRATPLTPATVRAHAPSFSPDGRRIAFFASDAAGRPQLWVSDTGPAGIPVRLTGHADLIPTRARWTADGRGLVYTADGRLWKVPAAGGEPSEIPFTAELSFSRPRRSLPPPPFPEPGRAQTVRAFMGLALSPDARSVAMLALGRLWVMPVGGAPRAVADVPPSAHHAAWSPDGRTIAWSAGAWQKENVYATDLATGTTRRVTALAGDEDSPAFSPDGKNLVFLHQPSEQRAVIRVVSAAATDISDTGATRAIEAEPGAEVSWTPSSDLLYLTGGFAPAESTRVEIIRLSGERHDAGRLDSPLLLQWTSHAAVFIRHARLWRAPFDSAGRLGPAEPMGVEPAMYPSLAQDGSVLFISDGGLRLLSPDGRKQTLGWPLTYTPPVAAPVLIRNVRIIDGTGRPATAPQDLLVESGRISRIAGAGTIRTSGAEVVDGNGAFVIPGLMDLHAHEYRPALLPGFSYFGVTTVRDQGSPIAPIVAYADLIAAGKLDGPRVDYGGFQFYSDWAYDLEDGQGVEPEADPQHLERAVALARIFGSQHIKTRTFRRWDINARFIAEAHRLGMRATGHCSHLLPLVAAGMDAKEHAGFCEPRGDGLIYDDLVQLFRAAGIGVVPTISYSALAVLINEHPHALEADSELAPFLPEQTAFNWMMRLDSAGHREFTEFANFARRATAKWQRAGVTIGTGTDIWQVPTGVHMELEQMVAAGLSPLEAIHAATAGSARIIGIEREVGTVEVGKWADLVLLDADPTADIRNTRRIRAVMQAGRLVDRAGILRRVRSGG